MVSRPESLIATQIPLVGGAPEHWTRRVWDPAAAGGAGDWVVFAEETETVEFYMHLPRDWTRTPGNAGGAAYPYALRRPDGTSVVSVSSWGKPGTPALYDPGEGVSAGIIAKGLIDKKTETALDDQPLVYGAEWNVNGRFFGLLHVPEEMVRPHASLTALVAQGERPCTTTPLLPWAGQSWSSASCWSAETRFPAARLLPYTGVPPAAYRVSGGAFSLQADLSRLTVRLEPPAGKTVTLTADLRCVPAPTGGCVA